MLTLPLVHTQFIEPHVYYTWHVLVLLVENSAVIANTNISTYLMASQKKTEPRKRKIMDEGSVLAKKNGQMGTFCQDK